MPKKYYVKKGRRRLQAAVAGLYANAAAGALAAQVAKTYKGPVPKLQSSKPVKKQGKKGNLRGTGFSGLTMRHANPEGYIPAYSKIIGNTKTGLSFNEKIMKIINPPQTMLYNSIAKLETTSGVQGVSSFNINNGFLNDFFTFIQGIRSDSAVANTHYNANQLTNRVNHHWTSIQHTFLNSSNLACELEIYVFKNIQDIDSADQALSASSAWSYAESINGLQGVSTDGNSVLGKKPTDFSCKLYIGRYWRLISSNAVQMKAGESYKHYFRQHYNRQLAQYMLNGDVSASVKGHCLSVVYVIKGQVVGSSLTADISTGDAQVSVVRQVKTHFSYCGNNKPRDFLIGNQIPVVAAANQIFTNTDSSLQQTGYVEDA